VGRALIPEIKLLIGSSDAIPDGRALICESNELAREGSAVTAGTPDGKTPVGRALSCESSELRPTAFVGSALISEIKLLSGSPETAPLGRALICEIKELTNPDGTTGTPDGTTPVGRELSCESSELSPAGFVGNAFISETREPSPETAPLGRALISESKELNNPDGIAVTAGATPLGRPPT
jgi:hypothetical protein